MLKHLTILATTSLLLMACGTTVQKLEQDVDKNLGADAGYLLIGIETDFDLKSIHISGPDTLILDHKDVNTEASYILVDAEAGIYTFEKIRLDSYWRLKLDDEDISWEFEIKPNQISYVGDFEVNIPHHWLIGPSYVELINRSSEALEFLEENFPNILASREIVYTGPGNDGFFDFVKTLDKKESE